MVTGQLNQTGHITGRRRTLAVRATLLLVLAGMILACLCIGKYSLNPWECLRIIWHSLPLTGQAADIPEMDRNILLGVRLPRVLAAVLVGASLALAGAVYQSIFKNPLVSPDLLGVSSGACVGAAIAILFSLPAVGIQAAAFAGGISAVSLALLIPRLLRSRSNIMLVLSGIIVGGAMSSVLGFIKYVADPETQLAAITYWQLGSFAYVDTSVLTAVLPLVLVAGGMLLAMSFWVGVLSMGEREAASLGANVRVFRGLFVVCSTLLTASAVCISGTIGWVGLVIPHLSRMIAGADNRQLLPAAVLVGAIFMLLVDTVTRMIGPAEMPVSILTGIIGAPFYAWLLYRQRARLD